MQATSADADQSNVMFRSKQVEHPLKLIPNSALQSLKVPTDSDDEMEHPFSGMVTCHMSMYGSQSWIVDSGASDHMIANIEGLVNVKRAPPNLTIKLPTGGTTVITHVGDVILQNGLKLHNVLYVPAFKHNLLSIHRLAVDNNYEIQFQPTGCSVLDSVTREVKATGVVKNCLYYLQEFSPEAITCNLSESTSFTVWHHRLGHAPLEKLNHIPLLKGRLRDIRQVCITGPMYKFVKLPFDLSKSHVAYNFELLHIDAWGPYKIPTREKYKYF